MQVQSTSRKGSISTVVAAFLHFDSCFMLWGLLGALGIFISKNLGLNPAQQGLMVALPVLSGALFRIPAGLLSDRLGGKKVGVGLLLFLYLPLLLGWLFGHNYSSILFIGLLLGVAGSSFAVALPLASRWHSSERQGLVMGITAAGNMGTVISNLFAPRLATAFGWQNVLGLAMIPLTVTLILFVLLAKDSPDRAVGQPISKYLSALRQGDLWWFCLFYSVTFGGYVGLSGFLPLFFKGQYAMSPIMAGSVTALAAFVGSTLRPVGGYLADRFRGARILSFLLLGISIIYGLASLLPGVNLMIVLMVVGMSFFGMGNGAVFQMVPQRFRTEIGVATGIVGAMGGIGGFLLPILLGNMKQFFGSYAPGLVVLALIALSAAGLLVVLMLARQAWRVSWGRVVVEAQ